MLRLTGNCWWMLGSIILRKLYFQSPNVKILLEVWNFHQSTTLSLLCLPIFALNLKNQPIWLSRSWHCAAKGLEEQQCQSRNQYPREIFRLVHIRLDSKQLPFDLCWIRLFSKWTWILCFDRNWTKTWTWTRIGCKYRRVNQFREFRGFPTCISSQHLYLSLEFIEFYFHVLWR